SLYSCVLVREFLITFSFFLSPFLLMSLFLTVFLTISISPPPTTTNDVERKITCHQGAWLLFSLFFNVSPSPACLEERKRKQRNWKERDELERERMKDNNN